MPKRWRMLVTGARNHDDHGEICTRGCTFCNIATGRPDELDAFEPGRVADAVQKLGLNHVVITSVDRDDLTDGGAEHFAQTIRAVRHRSPNTTIEILTPDFLKCEDSVLETVVAARPDVFNHNLETVPGLYPRCAQGRGISIPCACCSGSRKWIHPCSRNRVSWCWAKIVNRFCRSWMTCDSRILILTIGQYRNQLKNITMLIGLSHQRNSNPQKPQPLAKGF